MGPALLWVFLERLHARGENAGQRAQAEEVATQTSALGGAKFFAFQIVLSGTGATLPGHSRRKGETVKPH